MNIRKRSDLRGFDGNLTWKAGYVSPVSCKRGPFRKPRRSFYDTFRRIETLLEQLRQDPDQGYFWSENWQNRIREGETDVQAGHTLRVTAGNVEKALEWLDE
ncbi:MAG: hypothetical protein U9R05_10145 [Chloroflexota bacterium]|nr:hypothetical protein [Chloroflexota bacterium]